MADPTVGVKNYREQGGGREVLNGRVAVNDEDLATRAAFTIGAEAADVINVSVQLKADADNNIAAQQVVRCFLSDDVAGDDITAAAPTGGVAAGSNGNILVEEVANILWTQQSDSAGVFDVDITDAGTPTFYLVVVFADGRTAVSGAITFA